MTVSELLNLKTKKAYESPTHITFKFIGGTYSFYLNTNLSEKLIRQDGKYDYLIRNEKTMFEFQKTFLEKNL